MELHAPPVVADSLRVARQLWFNHGRAAQPAARPSILARPLPRFVVNATATLRIEPYWPGARMPLSIAASVAIHIAVLVAIGVLLRAMPATVVKHDRGLPSLSADIIALPALSDEPRPLLPPLAPAEPIQPDAAVAAGATVAHDAGARSVVGAGDDPGERRTRCRSAGSRTASAKERGSSAPTSRSRWHRAIRSNPRAPPRVEGSLAVLYPVKAAAQGRSLTLSALLSIDAEGHVVEVRVLPDDSVFVAAVMAALRNARFSPATSDGKPIPYWAVLDFAFKIDGPTAPDGRRLDR